MKYKLLDILACPECKNYPLELHNMESTNPTGSSAPKKPECELFCSYLNKEVKYISEAPCEQCNSINIKSGYLLCTKCGRWYPVLDGIPELLPDYMRDENHENAIAQRLGLSVKGLFFKR